MSHTTITSTAPANAGTRTQAFVIDPDHSEVGFSVRHLLSRTRGRFDRFHGTVELDAVHPEASSVEFVVDAASIDTRQKDRDAHLRSGDFFDVVNHPEIRFRSTSMRPLGGDQYEVKGRLELRGVAKELALQVTFHGVAKDPWGGERAGFATETELNRKEFGMVWNAALDNGGFVLGDEVKLTIDLETIQRAQSAAA